MKCKYCGEEALYVEDLCYECNKERSMFAAAALTGLYMEVEVSDISLEGAAKQAFKQADAMMKARKGGGE